MKPHPWFNPPWRRALTLGFCLLWLLFEIVNVGASLWTFVAAGACAWAICDFYLAGHYPMAEPDKPA